MATPTTALVEFAERIRRIAYGNPIYYGIERAAGRPCKTTEFVDKRTLARCRHFHMATPASVRATFLRLPMGDSLTLEFVDGDTMAQCAPIKSAADEIVRIVFAGDKPESRTNNQPWTYFLLIGRPTAHEQPEVSCPRCAAALNRSTGVFNHDAPEKDDWTVCGYCTLVLRFNEDLTVRRATDEELSNAPADLKRVIAALERNVG